MVLWILLSKLVKIAPHFYDQPSDLLWVPAYLAYAYWHSIVKLYCALTFWNHSWGGRDLATVTKISVNDLGKEDLKKTAPARADMPLGITGLFQDDMGSDELKNIARHMHSCSGDLATQGLCQRWDRFKRAEKED